MIAVAQMLEAIAGRLNAIPELVELLGGPKSRIWAYTDVYPHQTNLAEQICALQPGEMLIAWDGVRMASEPGGYWVHQVRVCLRAQEEALASAAKSYYEAIRLLFEGVPSGGSCRMNQLSFLPNLDPMQDMAAERAMDETGADYFEARFTLLETVP